MKVNLFPVFIITVLCLHLKLYILGKKLSKVGYFTTGCGLYVQFIASEVVYYEARLKQVSYK